MQHRTLLRSVLLLSLTPLLGAVPAPPAELLAAAEQGYLGVSITETDGAVRVVEIYPETAAEAAGLQSGDLLLAVDGRVVENLASLKEALAAHAPGDSVAVRIGRGEAELELPVVLGKRPGPAFERAEKARARLERQEGAAPDVWVDAEDHEPRIHVERDGAVIRIEGLEGLEGLEALEALEGLEGIAPRIHIERVERKDGDEPQVWVWRSGDEGPLEIHGGEGELPEGLEVFLEQHDASGHEWQAQLDEHLGQLHEHLQHGWGELSEKLHELHEHDADDTHGTARKHWNHTMRDLERWREDHEDQLHDLHSRMRFFNAPRSEAPRDDSGRWFEGRRRGRAFDVSRPQVYRFRGDDDVRELRETVSELRDELRGLREELRGLREELRR